MDLLWFLPAFIFVYMTGWFLVAAHVRRWDLVDLAWGPGFIFAALLALYFREAPVDNRAIWFVVLICVWGLRTFYHAFRRNISMEEDWRYHRWHLGEGWHFYLSTFIKVFLFQGALMMIISLPVIYSLKLISLSLFSINKAGILLMIFGLVYETLADYQRRSFLAKLENKDKLIMSGLWLFCRHPNYFGEMLFWWGAYFLVMGAPKSWMLIVSPLTITYVLLFVSGLPMEERYRGRPDFEEYRRRTSAIIPWFAKKVG